MMLLLLFPSCVVSGQFRDVPDVIFYYPAGTR